MVTARRHCIPEMLSHQALFRCLDGDELTLLAHGTVEHRVGRHDFLYQKGEVPHGMHLVISGQIKLTLTSAEGVEKIVLMAGPGETFGEEAVFPGRHSPVTAQANKDSLLLVLDKHAMQATMRINQGLAAALMASMGERMCQLIENLETCVQRSSAQRVAYFLSQRAPEQAISFDLELDVNKSTIASQLNLAPETFSRVLSRLSREGLIDMKGRYITLRNLTSLRSFAG
jgi:CRP-like cAMP-binding protein